MSTTRFQTTLQAIKQGAKSFTVDKAVSNIEGWEDYLSKHDHEGVKKVVQDLGKLKKLLHASELDGEAIKTLVQKLGRTQLLWLKTETMRLLGTLRNSVRLFRKQRSSTDAVPRRLVTTTV